MCWRKKKTIRIEKESKYFGLFLIIGVALFSLPNLSIFSLVSCVIPPPPTKKSRRRRRPRTQMYMPSGIPTVCTCFRRVAAVPSTSLLVVDVEVKEISWTDVVPLPIGIPSCASVVATIPPPTPTPPPVAEMSWDKVEEFYGYEEDEM